MLSTVSVDAQLTSVRPAGAAGRLLRAAIGAFADKGFHATTTRDIASRAGLSPAGVYVHFASKEDLLFQLSKSGHETARDLLRQARPPGSTPAEALAAMVSTFARWHAEHFREARIVQYEFQHLTPEHREIVLGLRKEIDKVVRSVIAEGARSGAFGVDDIPSTTLALLSMCIDVARWYAPETRRTPHGIGQAYGKLALRLVQASPGSGGQPAQSRVSLR